MAAAHGSARRRRGRRGSSAGGSTRSDGTFQRRHSSRRPALVGQRRHAGLAGTRVGPHQLLRRPHPDRPDAVRCIGVDLGLGTLGLLRLVQLRASVDELPELDLVLVTHAHFDHLDTPSLAAVRGNPAAVMAASTSDLLRARCTPRCASCAGRISKSHRRRAATSSSARSRCSTGPRGFRLGDLARLHGVHRRTRRQKALIGGDTATALLFRGHKSDARSTPRSRRSAPTIPGSTIMDAGNRAVQMADAAARDYSCRCTISRSAEP